MHELAKTKLDLGMQVLEDMKLYGPVPDKLTYQALLIAASRKHDALKCVELIKEAKSRGIIPSRGMYSYALAAIARKMLKQECLEMFEDILDMGIGDAWVYSNMMLCFRVPILHQL